MKNQKVCKYILQQLAKLYGVSEVFVCMLTLENLFIYLSTY